MAAECDLTPGFRDPFLDVVPTDATALATAIDTYNLASYSSGTVPARWTATDSPLSIAAVDEDDLSTPKMWTAEHCSQLCAVTVECEYWQVRSNSVTDNLCELHVNELDTGGSQVIGAATATYTNGAVTYSSTATHGARSTECLDSSAKCGVFSSAKNFALPDPAAGNVVNPATQATWNNCATLCAGHSNCVFWAWRSSTKMYVIQH